MNWPLKNISPVVKKSYCQDVPGRKFVSSTVNGLFHLLILGVVGFKHDLCSPLLHPYLATWGNAPILAFIFSNVLKPPTSTNGQTVYFFSPTDPNLDPNFLPGTSWQYPPSALSQRKTEESDNAQGSNDLLIVFSWNLNNPSKGDCSPQSFSDNMTGCLLGGSS